VLGTSQFLLNWPYPVEVSTLAVDKIDLTGAQISHMVTGLSQHPNNFGIIISPLVAYLLVNVIRATQRPLLGTAALLFGTFALYGTAMKGAFFWVPVAASLSLLPRRLLRTSSIVIATAITAVSLIWFSLVTENALTGTMLGRLLLWRSAIENVSSEGTWLFGGDTKKLMYDNFLNYHWLIPHAHTIYLNNALYFGIFAAICFPTCVVIAMRSCVEVAKRGSPEVATAARGVLAATITLAGIGTLEGVSEPARFGLYFICFGCAGALGNLLRAETHVSPLRRCSDADVVPARRFRDRAIAQSLTPLP